MPSTAIWTEGAQLPTIFGFDIRIDSMNPLHISWPDDVTGAKMEQDTTQADLLAALVHEGWLN